MSDLTLPLNSYELSAQAVGARLRWARRQGRSAWLWPEISAQDWRRALHSIQYVCSGILAGDGCQRLAGEPGALGLACYTSGMGPLLGWWHAQGCLEASAEVSDLLTLHLEHNRLRSAEMREASSSMTQALADQGIDVLVLKGADTAERYFPDPATRPASDIDLLVRPGQAVDAEHVLRAAGYRLAKRSLHESDWRRSDVSEQPRSLMFVHARDPWSIDLHTSLNVELGAGLEGLRLDDAKPFENFHSGDSPGGRGLSQPLLLMHLAAHASTGLHNLTLLRLVELQFVIRKDQARGQLDWDRFLDSCRQVRALGAVWPALKLTEDLASGTVPNGVLRECSAAAPTRLREVVTALTPATAQRIGGTSIREHFMWTSGARQVLRQLGADLLPGRSWKDIRSAYTRRFWQVARGSISR